MSSHPRPTARPIVPLWMLWLAAAVPFAVFLIAACASPAPLADGPTAAERSSPPLAARPGSGVVVGPGPGAPTLDGLDIYGWAVGDKGTVLHAALGGS